MNSIKISVIIPVYNVENYISQALESVVNQDFKDIEIVCINDCTPDKSFEIVKGFAARDHRFVLLEQEKNQGQGIARNRGLEVARGDYIMFLDPDDFFEMNAFQKAYEQISKNKNDFVFFDLFYRYEKNGVLSDKIKKVKHLRCFDSVKDNPHIDLTTVKGNFIHAAWVVCHIYSREFLRRNNICFSAERFAEDLPFYIKALVCSKNVSILDEPLYHYRQKPTTCFDYATVYNDAVKAKDRACDIIYNAPSKDIYLEKYFYYRIFSDCHWLDNFSRKNKKIAESFFQLNKAAFERMAHDLGEDHDICKRCILFKLVRNCRNFSEYRRKRFWYNIFAYCYRVLCKIIHK